MKLGERLSLLAAQNVDVRAENFKKTMFTLEEDIINAVTSGKSYLSFLERFNDAEFVLMKEFVEKNKLIWRRSGNNHIFAFDENLQLMMRARQFASVRESMISGLISELKYRLTESASNGNVTFALKHPTIDPKIWTFCKENSLEVRTQGLATFIQWGASEFSVIAARNQELGFRNAIKRLNELPSKLENAARMGMISMTFNYSVWELDLRFISVFCEVHRLKLQRNHCFFDISWE